jgi:DNA helicase-2/ATP-dependent DNA helicase PcrA
MIGPQELAQRLGVPEPTPDQAAVIQAPLAPMAVIAGAGSGKSETMAARVVWLVANGLTRPERVLGLTFTRKAAAELSDRVRRRLGQLREHDDLIDPAILDGEPTVSTYHAYAARLFGDHALRAALEPTMRLITPAVAWQIAARVVDAYDGPMDAVEWAPDTVTKAVIGISGELSEHLRTPDDVRQIGAWLNERLAEVKKPTKTHQGRVLAAQAVREQLLPIVEAYQRAKAKREVFDHGDQLALAARIAHEHREVGAIERSRYGVVLLDEYQDTSHAQLVLLKSLFAGGHPVTAVGDPCQSIYGWRGASAGNLLGFVRDFPDGERAAPMRQLSTSFRNGERILDAAARIQGELREEAKDVPRLWPGAAQQARGRIECALLETVEDEAERLAERLAALLRQPREIAPDGVAWDHVTRHGAGLQPSEIAVLARKRSQFPLLRAALEARGIPVEVVGLGGLLTVPEVQDVVATLKVVHDPTAGASLARLLTGPRWRLGPRDLVALGRRARELAREAARDVHPDAGAPPERTTADPLRQVVEELNDESGSLIDALDDLGTGETYTEEGFARLERLRDELRILRRHVGLALPDLVTEVERTLGLDIEVAARTGLDPVTARADLDAFVDAAASFAGDAEDPTLGAFLAYLKAAESEEFGLEAGRVGETNSVKLLTVHAAKGLEWEVVAIPGLVFLPTKDGAPSKGSVFPTSPQSSSRWTTNARTLPYPLRGDRADLPDLPGLQKEDIETFNGATAERDVREERRLAYVAVTRAKHLLITTGYRWGTAGRPLQPSPFLEEIREACEAGAGEVGYWAEEPIGEENPLLAEQQTATWPVAPDPEDEGYAAVADGARMVNDAMSGRPRRGAAAYSAVPAAERGRVSAWARDVELLLAERDRSRGNDGLAVDLPAHLSVPRCRWAQGSPSPTATAAMTTSRSPISATARPTRARSTRASTWPSSGSCRPST